MNKAPETPEGFRPNDPTIPEGYTVWGGGAGCPIDQSEVVHVIVRGGIPRLPALAMDWPEICWQHRYHKDEKAIWDIVAYRIIKRD